MFEEIGERNAGLGGGLRWDGSHPHYPRTRSRCFALARLVTRAVRHRIDDLDPATTRAGAKARANVDDPTHSLRQTSSGRPGALLRPAPRSEERRVGKECRSRW